MHRSALMVQGILCFLLIMGMLMAIAPQQVDRAQKRLFRAFHLISQEIAQQPLHRRERIIQRSLGLVYLIGSISVLLNMRLQVGTFPPPRPAQQAIFMTETSSAALYRVVNDIVQSRLSEHVGLAISVIADGEQAIFGFGRINLQSSQPPDNHTIFEIGSLSKVFTGILAAHLIVQGRLSVDDRFAPLLPSAHIPPDSAADRITIRHLVTHTAGLPRMPIQMFHPVQVWNFLTAGDSYHAYTEENVLSAVKKSRRVPGERFAYSNVGFGALGLALSQQTGVNYQQMIDTMIAQPLGLSDTRVALHQEQRARLAEGYRSVIRIGSRYLAQQTASWEFPDCLVGAGGLRSTAQDMLRFLAANMGQQQSELTPALRYAQQVLFSDDHIQIGMGWLHSELPESGEPIIWHNGATGGYQSFLGFTENGRIGVVILSNSLKNVDTLGRAILERLSSI